MTRVKFFLTPYYIPDNYSPEAIALAEGLFELGVEVCANIDYWFCYKKSDFVLKKSDSKEYDIAVYDYKYLYHSKKWTFNYIDTSKINVLIDRNDWLDQEWRDTRVMEKFDYILIDHMIKGFNYPENVKPWAIGLTNRVKNYIDKIEVDIDLVAKKRILINARVKHNLRKKIQESLKQNIPKEYEIADLISDPIESLYAKGEATENDINYHKESAGRHNPQYYSMINNYLMTNCVGGYYEYKPFVTTPYSNLKKARRKLYFFLDKYLSLVHGDARRANFVFQYDSFRFWEVMYSHSCPIHLNFDYWGFILPVQPVSGKHYIGITDLDCVEFTKYVTELSAEDIRQIGEQGRDWCINNYTPSAVATRFIKMAKETKG